MGEGGKPSMAAAPREREELADQIGKRMAEISAHMHAAMAEIVRMAAEFDEIRTWPDGGYRSFGHWFTVNCGFDTWMGHEVMRVAEALKELPLIGAAFNDGRLSFDKVRAVTRVATAEEDEMWLDLALDASGNQLARICRAVGRALEVDSPKNAREQRARRGVRTQWLKNGMLHVIALLPPAEGQLLLQALDAATAKHNDYSMPAAHTWSGRRADALVLVVSRGLGSLQNESDVVAARHQVVVHVDFDLLTGMTRTGKCFLEDGPPIALSTLQRIGCTAGVIAMIEKDGKIIDLRPERRLPTVRQRRIIAHRDKTCLVPGCGMPAAFCEPHHVDGWAFSHTTEVDDLGSLCLCDHQRVHRGELVMIKVGPGKFRFDTAAGEPIPPVPVEVDSVHRGSAFLEKRSAQQGIEINWETALARGNGGPFDFGLTVEVAHGNPLIHQAQRNAQNLPAP